MEEFTLTSLLLRGAAVVFLVAANAFFVASEFALVAARRSRIQALIDSGDRKAKAVKAAQQDLQRQLSACQLGITLASILLGYVAEDTVAVLLRDWLERLPPAVSFLGRVGVASIIAVSIVSFLHVVVGELAPKNWAITFPEPTARWLARPLMLFTWITLPLTNLLNWSANQLLRLLGVKATADELEAVHSPEEIVTIVRQSQKSGHLDHEDVEMIEGVLEFTEKNARDVMTPRTEVVGLPAEITIADAADRIREVGRSRYPVYRESLDDMVGIVHVKDILAALSARGGEPVGSIVREPIFVPGTREVEDVLADMKRGKAMMAVVLDEYGGTAGIITMEDLLEEIVGEIYDEYDEAEPLPKTAKDGVTLPGDMEIEDLNERYALDVSEEHYLTIGGYVFGQLGRLPQVGDRVTVGRVRFEVLEMAGRRVGTLRMVLPGGKAASDPR
ncbi:MAG: HlyC/CorC family transporter [Gemmatimonadota bacterium]|nr:MAG: HlyC/CorC family transporter [Gemmatimonadota bacterium]